MQEGRSPVIRKLKGTNDGNKKSKVEGVQEFRSSGVKSKGVQKSGFQEFRRPRLQTTGVRSPRLKGYYNNRQFKWFNPSNIDYSTISDKRNAPNYRDK